MIAARGALWVVLALLGCAGVPTAPASQPAWVDGVSLRHPRARYVTGVGAGSDAEAAANRARAEVARSFEVRIDDVVRDQRTATRVARDGVVRTRESETISVDTRSTTGLELEGVEIAEVFVTPGGEHFALAVLDRVRAWEAWSARLDGLDTAIGRQSTRARLLGTPLDRVRILGRAVALSRERDVLARRARVVAPREVALRSVAPSSVAPSSDTPALEERLARALASLRISVAASAPSLHDAMSERLSSLGLGVAAGAEPTALRLDCRLGLASVARGPRPWRHVAWDGVCDLVDGDVAVLTTVESGSASHPQVATARRKARSSGERALAASVEADLRSFLRGTD